MNKNNIPDDNIELAALIDRYVKGERERAILKRRLIDLVLFEPLAEEFNLSVRGTKNIVYRAEEQLFRNLK